MITNKTKLIISCSSNPSNFGCKIYNYIFNKLDLNFFYFPIKTTNSKSVCRSLRDMNIYGASISMPMKNSIINFLDHIDKNSQITQSVNTVINKNGKLNGYNTDYFGFHKAIEHLNINNVAIYGSGSVVDSILYSLKKRKIENIDIYARNILKIIKLEKKFQIKKTYCDNIKYDLFINATPVVFNKDIKNLILKSQNVFDLKVSINDSKIIKFAKKNNINSINGFEMYKYQFLKQFFFYTGVVLDSKKIEKLILLALK